jgi:hypothetical protein
MTATTTARPATSARPAASRDDSPLSPWHGLNVEREDIAFTSPRPGLLLVEVTIRNAGSDQTAPICGLLRSAPLGVFVPWQLLDVVSVPALEPGESTVVRREYRYDAPRSLGSADKLPPNRVLTALGLGEPGRNRPRTPAPTNPGLAPDLLGMLRQGGTHWAGNLNLFFPGVDVERHVAQALRVYPGRLNLAMFIVGDHTSEYQFRLTGDAVAWNARLLDSFLGRPIADGANGPEVKEGLWHRPTSGMLLLAVEPPGDAEAGAVSVHVRQRSTDREAVVEFTMDSRAAGPGCYKL